MASVDIASQPVQQMIRELVARKVAVTSTLAVFESSPPLQQRFRDALSPQTLRNYLDARKRLSETTLKASALRVSKEVEFERAFMKAGGLLLAGADPTGNGSALAGFADQRNLELMVAGGFTPIEAIHIATQNGAKFLGIDDRTGSIAACRQADLVVIEGNPATHISDVENVRIVFKDGVGYDSAKLLDSVKGRVGLH